MKLLSPLDVGHATAPSRVLFGPHETNLGRHRTPSAAHTAYYERRAAGGSGIVVIEEASVHPSDWPYERSLLASSCGTGWPAIGKACHGHGALVLAAIGHSGGQGTSHWSQRELWAPSPVPEVATREVPKAMEGRDIDEVVAGFGAATRLAVAAGLDGVEVNAGQFSLIRQFLSGLTNQRGDEYGTDRSLFARRVLGEVRSAAGECIVALRLCVDEMAPWAGIVAGAGAALAVEFAQFVDLLTVVRGSIYTAWATQPDGHVAPGFGIDLARQVRTVLHAAGHTGLPVIAQGSIVEPSQAEWAIESGAADGVEMTRAQLADADLVAKVRAGQSERVRPCILCNQTCKVRDNRSPMVTCVVDPRTGHELEDPAEPVAADASLAEGRGVTATTDDVKGAVDRPRAGGRVTIVGAGVAGMECARVAALRGFDVHVLERSPRAGGVAIVAAQGAQRNRLSAIVEWLEAECVRLGVTFSFSHIATPVDMVATVVLATGGADGPLPFAVDHDAVVHHAAAVLSGLPLPDGAVAVWDPIAGPIAISVAERLAADGRAVTFITPDLLVGEKLSMTGDLAPSQNRLHGAGITLVKRALVRRVTATAVHVEDRFSGMTSEIEAVAVIACGHRVPDQTLGDDDALRIGDAVAPRTIHEAVLEGRRAAMALRR